MYQDKKTNLDAGLIESQQQKIQAILEVLQQQSSAEDSARTSILTALHLTTSALEGKKGLQFEKEKKYKSDHIFFDLVN